MARIGPPTTTIIDHSFCSSRSFATLDASAAQRPLGPFTGAQQIVPQVRSPDGDDSAILSMVSVDHVTLHSETFAGKAGEAEELYSPEGCAIPSKKFKLWTAEDRVDSAAAVGALLLLSRPHVAGLSGDRSVPSIDEDCLVSQPSLSHLLKPQLDAASPTLAASSAIDIERDYSFCSFGRRQTWRFEAGFPDEETAEAGEAVANSNGPFSFDVDNVDADEDDCDDAAESGADCQSWRLDVDLSLQCTRGRLWGCSDVIGSIDFDESGNYFATGGISRKIRVYSISSLRSIKERKLEGWRERWGRQSCEIISDMSAISAGSGMADSSGDAEFYNYGLSCAGSRRGKRRAASTSDFRPYAEASDRDDADEEEACILDTDQSASKILCCAAKLSSVMWVPGSSGIIGAGDYDGVFAEWDIEKGLCVSEREEHEGQRIWSVDYSQWMGSNGKPMSVSASDNGAVCLWSADSEDSVGMIRLASGKRAICTAKFGPAKGGENLLALAGADSKVYLYDLRNLQEPILSLAGHQRTVSYVRFMGPGSLVSSSVDSTVKLWDVTGSNPSNDVSASTGSSSRIPNAATVSATSNRSYLPVAGVSNYLRASCDDHLNVRNFVGLSVRELDGGSSFCRGGTTRCGKGTSGSAGRSGLIATGSESNELVIYHVDSKSRCSCALKFDFGFAKPPGNHGSSDTKGRSRTPTLGMTGRESSSGGEMRGSGSGSGGGGGNVFVSAVGWQQRADSDLLAAANSQGVVRILQTQCV
ncbi:unnamed protein product [Closterium sp. Yama58-4]|nr:unnamed protein product [Closterium sp. Yama58-4]